MHLRPQVSPLIRVQSPNLIRAIIFGRPKTWPYHLHLAWDILDRLKLPNRKARIILYKASVAGSECARKMTERIRIAQNHDLSIKVKQAFYRLSRCIERAHAGRRHLLDERVSEILNGDDVGLEVIEALLKASREIFEQLGSDKSAQTALRTLGVYSEHGFDTIGLQLDFSSLSPLSQQSCTSALEAANKNRTRIRASMIFEVLANAISNPQPSPRGAADIVIAYVAAVAFEWRQSGLRPSRATHFDNPSYVSKFHRFCDLVLTALVEPESRRHMPGLDDISQRAWARQRQLAREDQKAIRGGLPRKDSQWLVTAHCLRQGLRHGSSKKRARDSI